MQQTASKLFGGACAHVLFTHMSSNLARHLGESLIVMKFNWKTNFYKLIKSCHIKRDLIHQCVVLLSRVHILSCTREHCGARKQGRIHVLRSHQPNQNVHKRHRQHPSQPRGSSILCKWKPRELQKWPKITSYSPISTEKTDHKNPCSNSSIGIPSRSALCTFWFHETEWSLHRFETFDNWYFRFSYVCLVILHF